MDEYESLSHSKWECKYHVIFIPKCRRKALYGQLRKHLGEVFRQLAQRKQSSIEEGHLMPDHVHMLISIPPKYAVSHVIGYIKGKSAIHLARVDPEEAMFPDMPRNAIATTAVDYILPIAGMSDLLDRITREQAPPPPPVCVGAG